MTKEVIGQQEEHNINILDMQDSRSNREKVYSTGGVFFGKIYGCRDPSSLPGIQKEKKATVQVFLSKYTAVDNIRKSPEAKNNRNKICSKGKTLYVLGDVSEDDKECDNREYLVFSEASCVYKRQWAQLKPLVIPAGSVMQEMEVIGVGFVKERVSKQRKHTDMAQAYKIQFTNDPSSAVWVTVPGLQYMATLSQIQTSLPPLLPLPLPLPLPKQHQQGTSPQPYQSPTFELPPPLPPSLAERESERLKQKSLNILPLHGSIISTVTFGNPSVKIPKAISKSSLGPDTNTGASKAVKRTTVVPLPMLIKMDDSIKGGNAISNNKSSDGADENLKNVLPSFPDVLGLSVTGRSGPAYKSRPPLIVPPLSTLFALKNAGAPSVKPPNITQKL